jgi:pimeloyl-ACP methyl ester carboxylesterase
MSEFKKKYIIILMLIALFLSITAISLLYSNDFHLRKSQNVEFEDLNGEKLKGIYSPGFKDAGIILLEGFSSDQTALKPIASEFSNIGFHVFTFDFSGQGKSSGALSFDNAATDRLANQTISALAVFKQISGLNESDIIFLGHSMGARVALQTSIIGNLNISGLILIGAQINLLENVQSSFFTGVSDTNLEWVKSLNSTNPPIDILVITSTMDDILTVSSAKLLITQLGGNNSLYDRDLMIYEGKIHNYEIYSPEIISQALRWSNENLNLSLNINISTKITLQRNLLWILFAIGMFIFVISGNYYLKFRENGENVPEKSEIAIKIKNPKKYLLYKTVLWFAAIPVALLIFILLFIIPLGLPIFALIYVGFIGGYGFLLLFLYMKGKMPAAKGILDFQFSTIQKNYKDLLLGLGLIVLLVALCTFFFNSGFYYLFALNGRFIWLILLTLLTIPGFYIGQIEGQILSKLRENTQFFKFINSMIGLIPFFLFTILFLLLGSISGMISGLHGLIILAFIIISGNLIKKIGKSILLTAFYQAFLIQYLILPQTALFFIF